MRPTFLCQRKDEIFKIIELEVHITDVFELTCNMSDVFLPRGSESEVLRSGFLCVN